MNFEENRQAQYHRIYTVSGIKGKPTNSECIAMIADHLALKRKKLLGGGKA